MATYTIVACVGPQPIDVYFESAQGIPTSILNITARCNVSDGWAECLPAARCEGGSLVVFATDQPYRVKGTILVLWRDDEPQETLDRYGGKHASKSGFVKYSPNREALEKQGQAALELAAMKASN